MTTIYLIRHTQAEGNLYRMMQGHWNGGVTPLGFRQIDALAERFADIRLDAVYSSDLYRAEATASGLTRGKHLKIITDVRLREINVGPWETKFFGNVAHDHPDEIHTFIFNSESWKIDGAETFDEVRRRSFLALTEIAAENDGKDIAVVTHGVTTRCILSAVMNIPLNDPKTIPIMKNTAVTKLRFENGRFSIEYMNDASHLGDGELAAWNNVSDLRDEPLDIGNNPDYYTGCYKDAWAAAHGTAMPEGDAAYFLKKATVHNWKYPGSVMRILKGDENVGLVDLDPERGSAEGAGWIRLIYLKDGFRGTGHGIQLLARAFFFFNHLNRSSVRLLAAEDNSAALSFYRKNGFAEIGRKAGAVGPLLLMERKLGGISGVPSESSGYN